MTSGLARATVVVEAGNKSGARMQARLAIEQGRPAFLLSSLLRHQWAQTYANERPNTYVVDTGEGSSRTSIGSMPISLP